MACDAARYPPSDLVAQGHARGLHLALISQTGANAMYSYSARRKAFGMTMTSSPPPSDQPWMYAFLASASEVTL